MVLCLDEGGDRTFLQVFKEKNVVDILDSKQVGKQTIFLNKRDFFDENYGLMRFIANNGHTCKSYLYL